MSLFGAMTSGVSALTAQSSAMGAISDNISNVNTVGYKGTDIDFQTLVTAQASNTMYAAGGVQSRPNSSIALQGLLQSSSSQTDLAVSGNGFFVVNANAEPGIGDQFLYTRAGSFTADKDGYLRNTAGYYLQAWPTDVDGNATLPVDSPASAANQNIISTDFMETINLNRVGGTATPTSEIAIGANLPAGDAIGEGHSVDVQFFDTLGNSNAVSFEFTKADSNKWHLDAEPPAGSTTLTLYNNANQVYQSMGQLEFSAVPDVGQSIIVGGQTFTFAAGAQPLGNRAIQVDGNRPLGQVVADIASEINATFGTPMAKAKADNAVVIAADSASIVVDPNGVTANGAAATNQDAAFTIAGRTVLDAGGNPYTTVGSLTFSGIPDTGTSIVVAGTTVNFTTGAQAPGSGNVQIDGGRTLAQVVADIATEVNAAQGASMVASINGTTIVVTAQDNDVTINPNGVTSGGVGNPATTVTAPFSITGQRSLPPAIGFDSTGQPSVFNTTRMEIRGFESGAADMDGTNAELITLNFGSIGEADGLTQFGGPFEPGFIEQNGTRFGVFNGVSISTDGVMSALFDNGERRPIYKLPVATFVNPNSLQSQTGNAWNASEDSGQPMLREAQSGAAGRIVQSSLESSTVDIGTEFTKMIVVQRAYSAATRVISTADEMLDELVRVKR